MGCGGGHCDSYFFLGLRNLEPSPEPNSPSILDGYGVYGYLEGIWHEEPILTVHGIRYQGPIQAKYGVYGTRNRNRADSCTQETEVESTRTRAWEGGRTGQQETSDAPAPDVADTHLLKPGPEPLPVTYRLRLLTRQPQACKMTCMYALAPPSA